MTSKAKKEQKSASKIDTIPNNYEEGTAESAIVDLWNDLMQDEEFRKDSLKNKMAVMYDFLNFYDDGSPVKDVHGHIVEPITKKEIKTTLFKK